MLGKEVRGADPGHTTHVCCLTRTLANAVSHGCRAFAAAQWLPRRRPGPWPQLRPVSPSLARRRNTQSRSPDSPLCTQNRGPGAVQPFGEGRAPLPLYNPLRPSHLLMTSQAISGCL